MDSGHPQPFVDKMHFKWQDKLMTDGDGRQSVTRRELTTGRNFGHKVATVRQNLVPTALTGRTWANKKR
jgi:hypothetical protein